MPAKHLQIICISLGVIDVGTKNYENLITRGGLNTHYLIVESTASTLIFILPVYALHKKPHLK